MTHVDLRKLCEGILAWGRRPHLRLLLAGAIWHRL